MLARLTKCSSGSKGKRLSSASFFPGDSLSALSFCQEAQYTIFNMSIALFIAAVSGWCRFSEGAGTHYYCHLQVWPGNALPGQGTVYYSRWYVEG